jgi:uncharacterized protein YbjT (DUF2867 family)
MTAQGERNARQRGLRWRHRAGLLAGATGTVGREVVAGLAAAGAEVQAVTRSPGSARLAAGVQAVRGDLMNPDSLTG